MSFKIGDQVVHPQYGVGYVAKLEEREFETGVIRRYYEISIPGGSTVWVPLDRLVSGLRRLAAKSEILHCRKILQSHPSPLPEDARLRQANLSTRLKQGTIAAHCEVVRDLSAHGNHKLITGNIAFLLQTTQNVLCQEWAIVEGIPMEDAVAEVDALLAKSRQSKDEAQAA
jgi:Transcriptional regulators, similar to M. xanthus CarD